jgi:hypothetical protein
MRSNKSPRPPFGKGGRRGDFGGQASQVNSVGANRWRFRLRPAYQSVYPPSMTSAEPVMYRDASLAR